MIVGRVWQGQTSKVSVFSSSWRAVSENVSTKNCVYDKCDQVCGMTNPHLFFFTSPPWEDWQTDLSLLRKSSVTLDWRRQTKAQGWPTDQRSEIYPKSQFGKALKCFRPSMKPQNRKLIEINESHADNWIVLVKGCIFLLRMMR